MNEALTLFAKTIQIGGSDLHDYILSRSPVWDSILKGRKWYSSGYRHTRRCNLSLVLLDLSAAFDTIDHKKLVSILDTQFGVRGKVLQWFRSYFEKLISNSSNWIFFFRPYNLALGSTAGFSPWACPIYNIHHTPGSLHRNRIETIQQLEDCVRDIKLWMTHNLLKLNDDKTEIIVITLTEHLSTSLNIFTNIHPYDKCHSERPYNVCQGIFFFIFMNSW